MHTRCSNKCTHNKLKKNRRTPKVLCGLIVRSTSTGDLDTQNPLRIKRLHSTIQPENYPATKEEMHTRCSKKCTHNKLKKNRRTSKVLRGLIVRATSMEDPDTQNLLRIKRLQSTIQPKNYQGIPNFLFAKNMNPNSLILFLPLSIRGENYLECKNHLLLAVPSSFNSPSM
ncbi:hypothetical protein ACS0TY_029669 [Phlomoides rotata]